MIHIVSFYAVAMFFALTSCGLLFADEGVPYRGEASMVNIKTTQGDVVVELMVDSAPKACQNFLGLASKGYYDGLTFHRIIQDFMIQGGDPTGTGAGGQSIWGKPFEDEFDVDVTFEDSGILAMANSGPHTNGSQFFITTVSTPWLHMHHTIFGRVVEGFDVVKKIESNGSPSGRPIMEQKIIMITALVVEKSK